MTDVKECPALLPDYSAILVGSLYRPVFKLMAGDRWRMVRRDGKPVECETLAEANRIARERVHEILNPPILMEKGGHDDVLGIAAWRERKASEAEAERRRVFSEETAPAMFRNGRTIIVQRTRRVRRG